PAVPAATVADAPAGVWPARPLDLTDVAAGGPVESWMTGLHADQVRAVRRSHRGPALIRGASGTGKTVVALHRAAYLAERDPGRVLVTTPVRALVGVLASQYRRLSPTTTARVEFATFLGFALRVLADRGVACNVDPFGLDAAFRRAWDRLGGSGLGAWAPPEYWREEIGTVIKGRGLERFDQYLRAPRPGRTVPLTGTRRRDVWELHLAYTEELGRRDLQDWYDVVRLARDCIRQRPPSPPYRAVVADEIGDLPLTGLQVLHAVVGDRTDGLLLVGDCTATSELGPAGLRDAGVDVGGRSTVMRNVYRETGRLLEAAVAVVPAPDDEPEMPFVVAGNVTEPDGKPVRHDVAPDRGSHDRRLLARLREDLAGGVAAGDVAVLCHTDRAAVRYRHILLREGVPVAGLDRQPTTEDAVKVGTVAAALGRQFAAVYLPAGEPLRAVRSSDQARDERQLRFAAMTTARDRLWVGTLDPPPV
ncbi:MAG: DEAD/DEAH box helicase, partial [Acidimicrobiales bacterium]